METRKGNNMSEQPKARTLYLTDKEWADIKEAAKINHRGNRPAFIQEHLLKAVKRCLKKES